MAERPLYTLYKNLKAQNYDVPDDYNKFESALTRDGKSGANNRHAIYENLKAQNFDVPSTYERFYSALFEPRSKTSSRAKGGSVPMSAADRARFSAGAAAISASAKQIVNNAGRYNRLKQRKQKQQKDFGRVNLGTHLTPFGGDANNVVKDEFAYNPETGKAGAYVTSDNENAYTQSDAEQKQAILDKYGEEWNKAVDMGMVPSELDKADPGLSDTDVAMKQMERRQEWLDENQNRRSKELNESMHLQDSPFVASGGAVAPSSFNAAIGNEANRLSDAEYGAYNTAKAYNQMLRTTLLQELKEQKQRNEDAGWWKDKWNDVSNYFGAMFNTMLDPKLYSQGVMDAAIASNLRQVKKGMEDGTIKKGSNAGEAAQVMLSAIQQQQGEAAKQQLNGTKAYQYGDVSGRSLKFMGDFALSGWRNVMTTGFTKAGEKVGEKMALGALGKWFTKNTGRVLGDMAGSAALAATNQLGSTYNNVIERYVGMNNENGGVTQDKDGDLSFNKGVSLGKAIKDGLGSATIENFSEMFGEYLPGASKILSKLGLSKVSSFFEKIGNNAYYKWLSNATNKSGIQGVMSEIAEEEFGTALHAAWGDGDGSWSDFNVFTNPDAREKQIDTCLGMFYSVGFMQSPRTAVGAINAVKYFNIKHQVTKADKFGQMMFNDKWDEIKSKIDVTTNADLTKTVLDATRSDSMTAKQKGAVINYAMFLSKLRGFNQASDAKTKDKVEEGETAPTLSNDLDDAYTEGHNADDADKHDIQIQHEDQAKTLAAALNISEQQLSGMSDEELESLTGQDDKLDQAIYDYQLSTARYQGVVDDAQDKVDLAAHQAEQRVNMYTDQSRGSVRNATIKASGGAEDYGVYIISGNIATHDDGSIDVSNSDDMILYFDPTTNSVEHADALMFAELGEELPADEVKAQAVADAKENAIKEVAGIIDGTVEVGSQFSVTDADGTEHTYEVLADNGDGTAMITIDGNVPTEHVKGENVQIPYSFEDLQKMKDLEDQKRLEAAKTEREQMEKERDAQETEQTEESQPSFDFNQILNDNGNVVLVDVLGKDGNTKYPGSKLFLIRDAGAKAKVVELKSDGTLVPHAVNKEDVATISTMTLDEYKQAMPSSMIEENSGEIEGDRGGIEVNDELPPVPDNVTINGDGTYSVDGAVQGGENTTAPSEQTEQTPAITLEDGTIVPMLEDGNPDFSKLSAAQTAELYDTQFDEDADGIVSGYVSDAKKALDKANNMTVKGKTFVEQKTAKVAKEKAIADAQAAYDSAVAIRDAYNERQLAKEENTPEGRKSLIEKARRKYARLKNSEEWSERSGDLWNETVGKLLHRLYDATGIDVFNDTPNTVYEYVAANVGPYSLNYEGNDNSKGVQQETGLSRSDFAKLGWLAAEGKGMTIDAKVHRLWENRPSNLESADTQEIRNALIGLITSGQTAFQARDYILNQRIELAESALEEQLRQEEDAAEAQKSKEEEEKKKAELEKKAEEEKTNENRNTPELSHEQQKAMEEGGKLGFPAVDKEGEPINQNVIELANWAKEQGLEIDPTSKLNSYADLYVMCKDGFGVSTLVPDVGENINQVFYFPDNVQGEQLLKLQEEFNVGRDLKHSADMNSELTEGAMFYDGDTAREFKEFVDKKVEMQNKVFGEQRPEEDLPFSAKDNGQQQTTSERAADVEKNKVDDMKVVDNIVGQKTRKAFDRLAKMMGANIQWQYSDKLGNGWIQETKDADGNVHRTIFITLDSSITKGAQFIFGHEMTHQIKNLNPAAYNELAQLVLDTYGSDAFDKAVDETMQRYSDAGFSGRDREYYAEEVVADAVGEMIRDLNLAHTLAMKMSHPLLAAIHEILQKIKLAFFGTEYSDVTKNIIRSIEQAYVKTAHGQVTNSETGEDVSFSLRQKPEPKKKGIGYKVFVLKDGKLYPPMVANPNGAATPVGVWLDADAAPIAGESKTGRPQVKQGGKGTQGGSGKLAYRPGWHLGVVPYAIQFNRKDAEGNKTLFPKNFVFAEVEYAADVDYQEEARQEGINPSGKYQHSLAGLKHLPTDGYYMYRTNPNPETDPWVITGAMKVNRILTRAEQAELVKNAGREPQQMQEGDIVTDDVVNSINQEIADAPKFSLKVYHGSGADFTEFDFDHIGEGAGSQVFGWGGYVTSSKKIGKSYAKIGQMSAEDRHRHASSEDTPIEAAVGSILGQEIYNERAKTFEQKKAQAIKNAENSIASFSDMLKNSNELDEKGKKFLQKSIEKDKKKLEVLRTLTEEQYKEEYIKQGRAKNLYEVDIPEDNGSNYLDWENQMGEEQINAIRDALAKNGIDVLSWEKRGFKLDLPFKNVYAAVLPMMMRCEPKEVSKFLSSLGFTGIKYPAGTIQGGAEEGDTNYVIFKPEDMRITEHTKFSLRLKSAIEETETNPSDAQKESGNYKKGHIKFGGYDYTIENPKGSTRSGKDANGKEWKVTMHDTYGYIRGKFGKDGDHLDMFINDKADLDNWDGDVFVVDQVNPDGSFDEHKVMYGYDSMDDAEKAYLANYSKGWKGLGNITGASKTEFDKWLDTSNRKIKPFAGYAKVKFSQAQSVSEPRYSLKDIKPIGVGAFGNIYNQFRGKSKAAIEFLKKLGSGEATAALHHHTIGDISLVWGDKKAGLDKILRKHPEVVDNLQSIIDSMEVVKESDNRVKLESPTHFAVVSKEYKGEPREQWLLTAYEKRESLENDKSMDTATSSLGGDTALSQSKGSAAKIDNSSETAKENGEKFSLKDEKTLAGVHNITEEKLRKAIKQGGLANPSVAVIDSSKQNHEDYGDISLILSSDKVAKRTGKNAGTWQGDAWTPTYPQVERQMSNKGAGKASKDVSSVPGDMYREVRRGFDRWLDGGEANSAMAYMFLHEKGVAPEPKKIQYKFSDDVYNELKSITAGDFNVYGISKADAQKVLGMYIDAKFDGDKDLYEEKTKAWLERNKSIVDAGNKGGMRYTIAKENVELYDEYGFNFKGVQTFVRDVEYDHRKTGVDMNATLNEVEDYIKTNNLTDEFNTWLEGKEKEYGIKEVIFDGFTPSGNRRYVPNTLENVSKIMKKQGRNGATGISVFFQNFAASLMPSYGTLNDIRSKKGLLTSDYEDLDKFNEKWSKVFFELGMKCQPDATGTFDDYGLARLSEAAKTSDPQAYLKKEYNVDFSDEDTKRLKEMVKAIKEESPAMYFETKFERPVGFNEFSSAVVPTTASDEVKQVLQNAGVQIYEYDKSKEGDRNRAFNEAVNSSDNIRFSLRYDKFEHDLNQWKKDNNLPKDAKRPTIPQRNVGESAVDFLRRVDEYRKQMALWKTAPTYEQHLLSDDTALGEFNRELQRGSVLKRIAFQDSMLAIRKAQEAIMKEVGVDRLNMAEDAYTAENRSHGKGKNEFEEYNNEFLQPLRKAYHQMKKVLGDSYDNVRLYMMAKHGLERNAQMAFKKSLEADYEDVAQRSAAYKAYKGDIKRMGNDSGFELGLIDYATWVREDNAIKMKYSPSYMKYRYDKMGIAFDYSGLSALFDGSDFEEAAYKLVRDIESKHIVETKELWDATNAATKKILRDGYKAGMMSKDTYQYVRDMYSHYIPLRGWDGTTADQVWDYVGCGKGAFNQTLKTAHGRTSIADDPIAYIENMAESGILLNNKNWVKQHLMLLAQNHPTSLLTLSKAWYVKSTDANGNEEWIPATPQITSQMNSNQVKAAIDAFEKKMEQMAQTGDATQKRDGLNIAYPQTHSEEREHEVRVMKDGEEYVIYVNGDPQLAQAMNNTRAHRVREIQSGKLDRAAAWLGRKMAAAYTSLSPLFIPSNYFRDLTMTLASTAIREDAKYNYLLRKNLATSWNLGFMLRDYQSGKLKEKVSNGNATPKEQMFYDFMMNGGETGFVSSLDVEDLKKKFKNDLKDLNRWKANPVKVGHTIMDSIEFLNRAIEDSNRFAIYMTSIQYGRSIDEAVNDAKDVTLNFNRKGTGEYGWQMIRNLYLFINPAVQSLQTLGALAKHHPFKFTAVTASWLASGVLVPIVNAALMSLLGGDDDKDKYWQFTKWDRRNNLIMWVPFTHEYVKIPLAQEFRAFYGVGDMIASKMMGGELAEESWSQYAEDLLGQVVDMLPLDPTGYDGNIAVSLMPNAIRPVFELAFNVDFTGKPLFKDTEYNKYDPNFTKAYVGTPDWLVRASKMVNSIGNDYPDVQQNSIDAFGDPRYNLNNPAVVDHILSSYLGGAYTMGSQVLGLLTKSLNDTKKIKVADIPLVSKFVSNPDDRPVTKKQGDEFWDMKENHDRAANTLSKLKKQAKVDGDYSMLERFYGSEEYRQYKQDDVKVKKYEEDKKRERAEESGEEYRPHKLNAWDIYKAHATPKDDFEDLKLKQLYTKLNGFKSTYDLLVDTAPSQSDGYYNANKAAIDAIDEVSLDKQEISELKKGFLDDGKDAYNAEDMKRIRELRKKVLAVLENANKIVVANQKAKKK